MIYIICYDITNDALRTQIAKLCENYAFERMQFSIFIGNASRNIIETFALEATEIIKKRLAKISIIPVCQNCYDKVITLGEKIGIKKEGPKFAVKIQEKVIVV